MSSLGSLPYGGARQRKRYFVAEALTHKFKPKERKRKGARERDEGRRVGGGSWRDSHLAAVISETV